MNCCSFLCDSVSCDRVLPYLGVIEIERDEARKDGRGGGSTINNPIVER